MSQPDVLVLFVCMGNICRSPTAHGVFQSRVLDLGWGDRVLVDSAGTHNYHPDAPPDARSQAHAKRRGYDLSVLRARQVTEHDFVQADLIVAMDAANIQNLEQRCPPEYRQKLRLLTEFCQKYDAEEVPDPYYGGAQGFERVLDLIEDACEGLVQHLESVSKGGKTPVRG